MARKGKVYTTKLKRVMRGIKSGAWVYLSSGALNHLSVSCGDIVEVSLEIGDAFEPIAVIRPVRSCIRNFSSWKKLVMSFLGELNPKNGDMDAQRRELIERVNNARSYDLGEVVMKLYEFCKKWRVPMPDKLMPTSDEMAAWCG